MNTSDPLSATASSPTSDEASVDNTAEDEQSKWLDESPKKRQSPPNWVVPVVALLVAAGLAFILWRVFSGRNRGGMMGPPAVPVKMERLQQRDIEASSEFIGRLDARAGVSLQPEAAGRISQIFVSEGDFVAAGDPIMQLEADGSQADFNAAISNINATRAARDAAAAQLRAAVERQAELEADVALQDRDFERTAVLVERGALAQEELDQVRRDRTVAQAALSSAEQEISALIASRDQAQATLDQAEDSAQATQQELLDKTVTAPIAGIVGNIPINLGDYVNPGDSLATITENDTLDLEISVDVGNAGRMRSGLPVELMLTGSPDVIATGNIFFVSPTIDSETQTVLAKARFSQPDRPLQDSQRLSVRVIWSEQPGILIPATAISRMGGQTFVFVPGEPDPPVEGENAAPAGAPSPDGPPPTVARMIPVQLGQMQGNDFQVIEGLEPGDTVITSGLLNLRDGVPIQPESESAPDGEQSTQQSFLPAAQ